MRSCCGTFHGLLCIGTLHCVINVHNVTYQLIVIKDAHCLPQNYIRKHDEMFGFIFYVYECFPACILGVRGGCEP